MTATTKSNRKRVKAGWRLRIERGLSLKQWARGQAASWPQAEAWLARKRR